MPRKCAKTVGSREQVYNGTRKRTAGGLKAGDLVFNPSNNRIVPRSRHEHGLAHVQNLLDRKGNNFEVGYVGKIRGGRGGGRGGGARRRAAAPAVAAPAEGGRRTRSGRKFGQFEFFGF